VQSFVTSINTSNLIWLH